MGYSDIKEMLKDARNIATGANDIQTVNLLKDIQLEVYDLLDENRLLRDEIQEMKNIESSKKSMIWKGNVYFQKNDGPFCTKCFDGEYKVIRMKVLPGWHSNFIEAKCPKCHNKVVTDIPQNGSNDKPTDALSRYLEKLD